MNDLPLVTVITPSLNQGEFIRETIESVLAQDYPRIEYLVQDGGSTDATPEILREYEGHLHWVSEPDHNQSNAINKAFARASGEIVCWLNSDDVFRAGAVGSAVAALTGDPEVGLVYGHADLIDRSGMLIEHCEPPAPELWNLIHICDPICQPSSFFRRSALEEVGYLDETLRWAMDYELFIRLSLRFPAIRVPEVWAGCRVYDETLTMTGGFARYREIRSVLQRYSRLRVPPAALHYLCELFEYEVGARLRASGTSRAAALLARASKSIARRAATRIDRRFTTVYGDDWVAPRARLLLPSRRAALLEVRGSIPGQFLPGTELQRLAVELGGHRVGEYDLDSGPFTLLIPLPEWISLSDDAPVELRVRASRIFVPARLGHPRDRRRLSWHLDSARWVGGAAM